MTLGDFVDKTIQSIDKSTTENLIIVFTDGSRLAVKCDYEIDIIGYFWVEEYL